MRRFAAYFRRVYTSRRVPVVFGIACPCFCKCVRMGKICNALLVFVFAYGAYSFFFAVFGCGRFKRCLPFSECVRRLAAYLCRVFAGRRVPVVIFVARPLFRKCVDMLPPPSSESTVQPAKPKASASTASAADSFCVLFIFLLLMYGELLVSPARNSLVRTGNCFFCKSSVDRVVCQSHIRKYSTECGEVKGGRAFRLSFTVGVNSF